ncbi:MAG: hypothetical protein NZ570_04760 [Candidatus Caldarchaeum sp.]|nr:hypothetical protein [Candidatus Caldarchaeum sp.]MDW7978800.1 hypothetical protein [Candidatus Caldarchaeum sp.]MDW8359927.1 hypothetical protein [Candidatus Caldarchaeum sp.]
MEVFAGLTLLFVGFIASFLMAVGLLEKDIILSLVVYSLSLAGIVVGLHGVLGWQHAREKIGS